MKITRSQLRRAVRLMISESQHPPAAPSETDLATRLQNLGYSPTIERGSRGRDRYVVYGFSPDEDGKRDAFRTASNINVLLGGSGLPNPDMYGVPFTTSNDEGSLHVRRHMRDEDGASRGPLAGYKIVMTQAGDSLAENLDRAAMRRMIFEEVKSLSGFGQTDSGEDDAGSEGGDDGDKSESASLMQEEEYDCIRDYMAMGYSRREAQEECRGSSSQDRHPLDVDGDGELTISEGPATSEMPASWQQILGDLLERK